MNTAVFTCILAAAPLATTGCRAGSNVTLIGDPSAPEDPSHHDAPRHTFSPRPHPPRQRVDPPAPDLAALPPLIDRLDECYGVEAPRPVEARPPVEPPRKPTRPRRSRGIRYNPDTGVINVEVEGKIRTDAASVTRVDMSEMRQVPVGGASRRSRRPGPARAPRTPVPRDWGAAVYLSNDDTMSLSSAQRVIHAIDAALPLVPGDIRPHELLNYFSFVTTPVAATDDFSVRADLAADPQHSGLYTLALAIQGRALDLQTRRNANLTLVVDRSDSMSADGRMDYLKRGLHTMQGQLRTGDLVHLVLFDHDACTPLENFVVGRDSPGLFKKAIDRMKPRGSTDVHLGLTTGYARTDAAYQPSYNNRIVLITDALANTGDTDPESMATISRYYDTRRIRLSGVGVGSEFNDELLDRMTEAGKGAYVFLGSEAEVDAVFGRRFVSLLETTALDVHFRLHLPPSLRMHAFHGEESSAVKADVQAIHYFADTAQLFLTDLAARGGRLRPQDQIMLTIEYEDPETGTARFAEQAFTLAEIRQEDAFNVRKGRLLLAWADRLARLTRREYPDGRQACDQGRVDLHALARGLDDPEVTRVLSLWGRYCARPGERP